MKLHLKKPIAFFDLETTGINVATDRIVEISILKINPDGSQEIKTRKINPTIPIPLEASLVHGIYDKDIQYEPTFNAVAKSLSTFFDNCDLAGFNSNRFDVPLLMEEFLRAEVEFEIDGRNLVDVQNIFHQMEQRTLSAGYKFYCGKDLENAHSAEADTIATFEILAAMLDKYKDNTLEKEDGSSYNPVTNDMDQLGEFSKRANNADLMGRIVLDDDGLALFNFGKYKGVSVAQVLSDNPGYYSWIMNGDFPLYTKKVLEKIKLAILQDKLNGK
jgi:DNA polymerase-3 subunit epsilon